MHTGDQISFQCHINISSGWEFLWYKDSSLFKESTSEHNILSVSTKDSGSYSCQTKRGTEPAFHSNQSLAVRLNIHGKMLFTSCSHFSVCACVDETSQFWFWVYRASKSRCSSPNWLVRCLLHWQLGAWVSGAGRSFMELHMVISYFYQIKFPEGIYVGAFLFPQVSKMFNIQKFYRYRDNQIIALVDIESKKYTVTPNNDTDQSQYSCKGISNKRPFYSEVSHQYETKNLREYNHVLVVVKSLPWKLCPPQLYLSVSWYTVLKRRVLLSISGVIFFGIILTFLSCILLRIFREPGFTFLLPSFFSKCTSFGICWMFAHFHCPGITGFIRRNAQWADFSSLVPI